MGLCTLGLIAIKKNSRRFPGKNFYKYKGAELWRHNYEILKSVCSEVLVASDVPLDVPYIPRGENVDPEEPIFNVWKRLYNEIQEPAAAVVMCLANVVDLDPNAINKAIYMLKTTDLKEIRGFDLKGQENGLIVARPEIFKKQELSTYQGAIFSNAREIHYKKELKR